MEACQTASLICLEATKQGPWMARDQILAIKQLRTLLTTDANIWFSSTDQIYRQMYQTKLDVEMQAAEQGAQIACTG